MPSASVDLARQLANLSKEQKQELRAKLGDVEAKTEDEATKARRRVERGEAARKRLEVRLAFAA